MADEIKWTVQDYATQGGEGPENQKAVSFQLEFQITKLTPEIIKGKTLKIRPRKNLFIELEAN